MWCINRSLAMLMGAMDTENLYGYPDVQALRAPPALSVPWQPLGLPLLLSQDPISATHGSSPCPGMP